ncbi:hypothetical protein AAFF_G00067040 [Aldrovandia affinis]|uniref:Uncharacterized protein n=1 Tax=Aldrovandia affinis TaxID=143900 RepID=A0AAD7T494_9TELE|nr:hypothetical protein AAFF_G00067040 [Aldrovandia affinis]
MSRINDLGGHDVPRPKRTAVVLQDGGHTHPCETWAQCTMGDCNMLLDLDQHLVEQCGQTEREKAFRKAAIAETAVHRHIHHGSARGGHRAGRSLLRCDGVTRDREERRADSPTGLSERRRFSCQARAGIRYHRTEPLIQMVIGSSPSMLLQTGL